METTYTIIGADGGKYGPVTLAALMQWVAEGRVLANTQVSRSDAPAWLPAHQFPELNIAAPSAVSAPAPSAAPPPLSGTPLKTVSTESVRQIRNGASWFYWVAGLSVVNIVMMASHQGGFFLAGMGIPQLVPGVFFGVFVSAVFGSFGYFAGRGHLWAFALGIIIYALDACMFLLAQDWLPLAFHAYVLYRLVMGAKGAFDLGKSQRGN